jgi:hypothetical protein
VLYSRHADSKRKLANSRLDLTKAAVLIVAFCRNESDDSRIEVSTGLCSSSARLVRSFLRM